MSKEQFVSENILSKEIQNVIDRFDRKVTDYKLDNDVNYAASQFLEMVYDLINGHEERFVLNSDIQKFVREFTIMTKNYFIFSKKHVGEHKIIHHTYVDSISEFGSDSVLYIGDYSYPLKSKKSFKRFFTRHRSLSKIYQTNQEYIFSKPIQNVLDKKLSIHNLINKKDIVVDNFKMYFSCAQYYSNKQSMGMLSPPIDFIWHTLASDTIAYKEFCDRNNIFVFHNPGEPTEEGFKEDYSNYLLFLKIMLDNSNLISNFEDINIFSIWPVPNSLVIKHYSHEIIGVNSGFLMFDTHHSLNHSHQEKRKILENIINMELT